MHLALAFEVRTPEAPWHVVQEPLQRVVEGEEALGERRALHYEGLPERGLLQPVRASGRARLQFPESAEAVSGIVQAPVDERAVRLSEDAGALVGRDEALQRASRWGGAVGRGLGAHARGEPAAGGEGEERGEADAPEAGSLWRSCHARGFGKRVGESEVHSSMPASRRVGTRSAVSPTLRRRSPAPEKSGGNS